MFAFRFEFGAWDGKGGVGAVECACDFDDPAVFVIAMPDEGLAVLGFFFDPDLAAVAVE